MGALNVIGAIYALQGTRPYTLTTDVYGLPPPSGVSGTLLQVCHQNAFGTPPYFCLNFQPPWLQVSGVWHHALIATVAMILALVAWLSRTIESIPALGEGTPKDSPRWAIAWWFIPIANFWKPYTIIRTAWDRLAAAKRKVYGDLVLLWWLAWVAAVIGSRTVGLLPLDDSRDAGFGGWLMLASAVQALSAAVASVDSLSCAKSSAGRT